LGKGAVFMSIDYYKDAVKEKLSFDPYPGTLNLKVDEKQIELLKKSTLIRINSNKTDNKTLHGASCYKARINNINGSIIIPDINKHEKDIIEFIAPANLKSELNIKDGDKVIIELIK
jgi:riboflavin kinase